MVQRADTHAAVRQRLVGRLARQRNEFVDAVGRQVLAGDEDHHRLGHRVHHAEVFGLELHGRIGQRRKDDLVGRALEEVVAVGRRGQHLLRGHGAAHAAQVLHDHLLAQRLAQRHGEDARGGVRRAAGRVGNHQVHGLGGKAVGAGGARGQQHQPAAEHQRGSEERSRRQSHVSWGGAGSWGRMQGNARSGPTQRPMHCWLH
ncbi:hypothetical protein D3C72_1450480 [compost metagenome]